ncbi:MAG TPA: hypothetical protein VFF69_02420 [Phycisphaerales bacterium]|nr:hypothetical protein [Phycisphaerales bacterium]
MPDGPAAISPGRTSAFTRFILALNAVLAGGAALPLWLAPERTDKLFAFEIDPPITAAWFGANFAAGAVLQLVAARQRLWENASQAVLGVLVYDIGILASLMVSLDAFPIERPAAWVWLLVYCASPLSLLGVCWAQRNTPRAPARAATMSRPARAVLLAIGTAGLALGLALMLAPAFGESLWPWRLVPQTGSYGRDPTIVRYAGAWHAGIGATLLHAGLVADARRLRAVLAAGIVAAPLTILAMLRFREQVDWSHAMAWAFPSLLLAGAAAAAMEIVRARRT